MWTSVLRGEKLYRRPVQNWETRLPHWGSAPAANSGQAAPTKAGVSLRGPWSTSQLVDHQRRCRSLALEFRAQSAPSGPIPGRLSVIHQDFYTMRTDLEPLLRSGSKAFYRSV